MQLLHLTYGIDLCANYASIRSKKKKKVIINNLEILHSSGFCQNKTNNSFFFTRDMKNFELQTSNLFHQQGQQEKRLKIEQTRTEQTANKVTI